MKNINFVVKVNRRRIRAPEHAQRVLPSFPARSATPEQHHVISDLLDH